MVTQECYFCGENIEFGSGEDNSFDYVRANIKFIHRIEHGDSMSERCDGETGFIMHKDCYEKWAEKMEELL